MTNPPSTCHWQSRRVSVARVQTQTSTPQEFPRQWRCLAQCASITATMVRHSLWWQMWASSQWTKLARPSKRWTRQTGVCARLNHQNAPSPSHRAAWRNTLPQKYRRYWAWPKMGSNRWGRTFRKWFWHKTRKSQNRKIPVRRQEKTAIKCGNHHDWASGCRVRHRIVGFLVLSYSAFNNINKRWLHCV